MQLQDPQTPRPELLCRVLRIVLDAAVNQFDLQLYCDFLRGGREESTLSEDGTDTRTGTIVPAGTIGALYDQAARSDAASALAAVLLGRLQRQAGALNKATAKAMLPPIMAELLPSVDAGRAEVQRCFQALADAYIATVGAEPPCPTDWARPAEVRRCHLIKPGHVEVEACRVLHMCHSCHMCPKIKEFLEDPTAREFDLTVEFGDHHRGLFVHVQSIFTNLRYSDMENVPYKAPRRNPHRRGATTRLTKTLREWEERHGAWEKRVDAAKTALGALPQDGLRAVLADRYDAIMALNLPTGGPALATTLAVRPTPAIQVTMSDVQTKRKHEEDTQAEGPEPAKRSRADE